MEPLYKDKQVTITAEYIVIRKYYFPLATSKTILMSQIEKVAMYDADLVNQKWGISSAWLNNWFPYDGERNLKKKFLEITLKGSKIKPSITPD